jgi:hypothetical protein
MRLDLPFDEALQGVLGATPEELRADIAKCRKQPSRAAE